MRKVEKPKNISELMQKYIAQFHEVMSVEMPESDEAYIHWDKLRRLSKDTDLNEKRWLKLKLVREGSSRSVRLKDKSGLNFKFNIPNNCHSLLHQIDELRARLLNFYMDKANKHEFWSSSLKYEESISSSQLEGAATTRAVALQMLEEERAPQSNDEKMILNNYLLMKQVIEKKDCKLDIDLILNFHLIATQGIDDRKISPGMLRNKDDVYVSNYYNEILHLPPSHQDLSERLQKLCDFANYEHKEKEFIHPIIKAIILHFMLGYEHPFFDGNGRTARALFYWFVMKNNYNEFEYISISKLLKEAPAKYARAYLYTETDDNDLTYFIEHQLYTIKKSIEELFKFLDRKHKEFTETLAWLSKTSVYHDLNSKEIILLKKAIKNPGKVFTAKEVKNSLGVTDNTARKYLEHLSDHKILLKSTSDRTSIYIARQDIVNLLNQRK
ncbi:Fic family protein [Neisseria sp. 83E34]|uniref:Fic family protein n=1 Tax=Neisseria sp. 83E34 TaxID=1692264 RepID=UPI0006CE939B|nr:Fic family protein [Neisseria sp. 83E34]KPN71969.1 hypothetical protein AKG09_04555 [Neisseria sp. 83E34]